MKGDSLKNKKSSHAETRLLSYLERLQNAGAELFVDGEAVPPGEVLRQTVQEQCTYMADYVLGEDGAIRQVRFDRVEL